MLTSGSGPFTLFRTQGRHDRFAPMNRHCWRACAGRMSSTAERRWITHVGRRGHGRAPNVRMSPGFLRRRQRRRPPGNDGRSNRRRRSFGKRERLVASNLVRSCSNTRHHSDVSARCLSARFGHERTLRDLVLHPLFAALLLVGTLRRLRSFRALAEL
jgi:hypothetical protein